MARKRRRKDKPFPKFDQMQPVDPDEFSTALNFALNAGAGKAIVENPANRRLNWIEEDGSVSEIRFADIPMNRAILAIHERYEDDSDKYASVASRIFGLFDMMQEPDLADWIKPGEELTEVHQAVIDAAATVMLEPDGGFALDEFLAKVKELAETKYKDSD